ncbi:kinase-like domain-containing protein [Aspergillus carlsbadensis]|nr:kinase-like domain-containing protein [Aspergillus carlsbadensis]
MGLLIKYGANTTIVEAETQKMVYDQLQGKVPVPEVYGWMEDGGQVFIYMALVEGDTLEQRWTGMSEDERVSVCAQLRGMAQTWRTLHHDQDGLYIGSINNQPLNEIFLSRHPALQGPYHGTDAVHRFHQGCDIDIPGDIPVVFTHNDLVPPNILLTPGPNPRIAAVIDWAQAGWYPAYWEYCKSRRIRTNPDYFDDEVQEEWNTKYLTRILDPVDDEAFYHPFVWFYLSKGV